MIENKSINILLLYLLLLHCYAENCILRTTFSTTTLLNFKGNIVADKTGNNILINDSIYYVHLELF